jgi:hypothetical protein
MRSAIPILIVYLVSLMPLQGIPQRGSPLPEKEDSLKMLAREIRNSGKDDLRSVLNKKYLLLLRRTLALPGSFKYPFDSLTTIARISSPDGKFRLYNWNVPQNDGTNQYFCLLQIKEKKQERVVMLADVSDTLPDPEHRILSSGNWYGALYYRILVNKGRDKIFYTLLGWDGCTSVKYQKIIDVMTFDGSGDPVFGAGIFRKFRDGMNVRVLFEYSSSAAMALRYSRQEIPTGNRKWDPGKKMFIAEKRLAWLIVFDQLGSLPDSGEAGPSYNVPIGENFDGFLFGDGCWNFIQNIQARD